MTEVAVGVDPFPYRDRASGGAVLAHRLGHYAGRNDVVVLALPRGGVPVGFEVARVLGVPLDVFLVRKLGAPGHEELAMGAISTGGIRIVNEATVSSLGISAQAIDAVTERERRELERRQVRYRGDRPDPDLAGKVLIVVDDGLATGSSMLAAVAALRAFAPARLVVAVPAGSLPACGRVAAEVDELQCPATPRSFSAVGLCYVEFDQTTDDEVCRLLEAARLPEEDDRERR